MGGFEAGTKTELWKSTMEKTLMANVTPADRHIFALIQIPDMFP